MRVYKQNQLESVFCNKCGKKIKVQNHVIVEGAFELESISGDIFLIKTEKNIPLICVKNAMTKLQKSSHILLKKRGILNWYKR